MYMTTKKTDQFIVINLLYYFAFSKQTNSNWQIKVLLLKDNQDNTWEILKIWIHHVVLKFSPQFLFYSVSILVFTFLKIDSEPVSTLFVVVL